MIRRTRQRDAILDALERAGRPLSPTELHDLAREMSPRIGLRTVYRNIRELVEEGRLAGIDYPGQPLRYEKVTEDGHRAHLICRLCSKVFDLPGDPPKVTYDSPEGFVIQGDEVVFYGHCATPENCPHHPGK